MERTESMETSSPIPYSVRSNTLSSSSSPSLKLHDQAILNSFGTNYLSETDRYCASYSPITIAANQGYNHGYVYNSYEIPLIFEFN